MRRWLVILLAVLIWPVLATPAIVPPVPATPDSRFGIVESYQAPKIARQAGSAWERMRFHWAWIQPDNAEQWIEDEVYDSDVTASVDAGRDILGLLIATPVWARDEAGLPKGLWLDHNDPNNLWATWVRTATTRYKGQITHWIIWNEPEIWQEGHPARSWVGSEADFAQLQKVSYLVAKEVDPNNEIHLPGFSHYWDANFGREPYLMRLLDTYDSDFPEAAANNYYFDSLTYHFYFNPAANYQLLTDYVAYMRDRGLDQPLWLVETNAAPSLDPYYPVEDPTFLVSLEDQAAYIPQMLALTIAADVERTSIYTLLDPEFGADPEPFGLVRRNGPPRPALQTLSVATRVLADAESAIVHRADPYWWVEVRQPDRVTHIVWAAGEEDLQIEIPRRHRFAKRIDAFGKADWLVAYRGNYHLELPASPCTNDPCMIGGMPIYLVEMDQ